MIEEEESERLYKRERILECLLERSKESLANELYNISIVEHIVDCDDCEDGIPYMGWFWRDFDFTAKDVSIGRDENDNIGVMTNNKWGYPERQMTEMEVDTFMNLIDRVIAIDHGFNNDISFYKQKRCLELRKWVQELCL